MKFFLQKYDRNQILNKLNQVYREASSQFDPVLAEMQFLSFPLSLPMRIGNVSGLPKDAVVNVSQVMTIDKTLLTERVSSLPAFVQQEVDERLRMILYL